MVPTSYRARFSLGKEKYPLRVWEGGATRRDEIFAHKEEEGKRIASVIEE